MEIKTFQGGYDNNFSYVVSSQGEAAVIDCFDIGSVLSYLQENDLDLKYVISTHSHFDHVDGNEELLQKTKAKLVMHELNECDVAVKEGDALNVGDLILKILETPGHTPDSICILVNEKYLFTGDTLFVGCVGRIFYEQGYLDQPKSLERIKKLSGKITIYPGHHYGDKETMLVQEL